MHLKFIPNLVYLEAQKPCTPPLHKSKAPYINQKETHFIYPRSPVTPHPYPRSPVPPPAYINQKPLT